MLLMQPPFPLNRMSAEPQNGSCRIQLSLPESFPDSSDGKESSCNVRDLGLIPELGRSPGGKHGNPLQYSCLVTDFPIDKSKVLYEKHTMTGAVFKGFVFPMWDQVIEMCTKAADRKSVV